MTELAQVTLAKWSRLPDGHYHRPGLTVPHGKICLSDGLDVAHSHYAWAVDELWACYGDMIEDQYERFQTNLR